ncbi:hypothetical protein BAY61_30845 [Prauserella marina]|uniref:Uncharacterized protein n=1 Tax=Prauserella marina TaxID=530584 RepID=A0A222VXK4_9PSEU|nr:DUF2784 domain-containing protein [Prauserella marina]ASR38669.1 hypothetical protein BAY61_30845 [Prauserella marina]PWV82004.1 uncharacterized protein DUF2784 [Prauserella marina]SDD17218.1 Protein of Unknown function [Prauserella marina]
MLEFFTGLTTAVHFLALIYIGLGGFLAWKWPKTIFVHVFFALWGVAVNVLPLPCPLTVLEDYLRELRGLGPLSGGFNEYYIYGTIFPREALPVVGVLALLLVVVSYIGAYLRWRNKHHGVPERRVGIS